MNSLNFPADYLLPSSVIIKDGYLGQTVEKIRRNALEYQWRVLNDEVPGAAKSNCIDNFRIAAGLIHGKFYGEVFQDSDFAKWVEAVAYSLMAESNPELEKAADEVIDLMEKAQLPDGYLDTYFISTDPSKRWTNLRDCHELYCAGHLLEGAIAYYQATGKRKMLDIMIRYVDYICTVFGDTDGKCKGYPGHPEIELALCKLYDLTGEERYLKLASFFLDRRGEKPFYFETEQKILDKEFYANARYGISYAQWHLPVRQQKTIEGHAVRALYLASGMADVAMRQRDAALWDACKALFDNLTRKRMYVTGGAGSTYFGEAFTFDYDLPGDTAYSETCAAIAIVFFARRMLQVELNGKYADAMETALYNTCLAGISLDCEHYFYVNPLSAYPEASRRDPNKKAVLTERQQWMGCACCPTNIARLLCSLGEYQYTYNKKEIQMHLYLNGEAHFQLDGKEVRITVETKYPEDGHIVIRTRPGAYSLQLRIPGWCHSFRLTRNGTAVSLAPENGYIELTGSFAEETIVLDLDMPAEFVTANLHVRDTAGKIAVRRGPVVYCAEEKDNSSELHLLKINTAAPLCEHFEEAFLNGTTVIDAAGYRETDNADDLYMSLTETTEKPVRIRLIPYHKWANRGSNEMEVWLRRSSI